MSVRKEAKETEEEERRAGTRPRAARILMWSERGLIVVGLVCLVAWVSACARSALYQQEQEDQFAEQVRGLLAEQQPDQSEWSARRISAYERVREASEPGEALARITIPAAGVSAMVLEGTEDAVLDRAVGRIPGTANIGEEGNLGLAGHRDGFFRGLRHIEAGDEIRLATLDGVTRYRVSGTQIVQPEDVEVLDPTDHATMTLVTCYPFYYVGSAPQRFIVHAERVDFDPWTDETAATYLGVELAGSPQP